MSKGRLENQSARPTIVSSKPPWRHNKKVWFVVLVSILIAAIVALVIVRYYRARSANQTVIGVCSEPSNPILKEAVADFVPGKQAEFTQVTQKIMKLNNYQQDPNCLYVIVVYDISTSNVQGAHYNLYLLQKIYDPKKGFDPIFGQDITITNLQDSVTALGKALNVPSM